MSTYEEPTNEFRQVKVPIKRGNDICGPGYYEIITGYDITIQRKWTVYDEGVPTEIAHWTTGKTEWRDIPTVSSKDAP